MSFSFFDDTPDDDSMVIWTGRTIKRLKRIIEQLASPTIGPGLRYSITEAQLTLWADGVPSGGSSDLIPAFFTQVGGSDGILSSDTEASWLYDAVNAKTGALIGTRLNLFGHRPLRQTTMHATCGLVIRSSIPGVNGPPDDGTSDSSGSSSSSSGASGSHYYIWECDEWFPTLTCSDSGGGSASDSSGGGSSAGTDAATEMFWFLS